MANSLLYLAITVVLEFTILVITVTLRINQISILMTAVEYQNVLAN